MNHRRTRSWLAMGIALGLGASGAACSTVHMKPPAEAGQGVEQVRVTGLSLAHGAFANEDFAIGLDQVSHVSRGLGFGASQRILFGFVGDAQAGYAYDVAVGDGSLHGQCEVETFTEGVKAHKVTFSNRAVRVACACGIAGAPPVASFTVGDPDSPAGKLALGGRAYGLTAIHDLEGGGQWHEEAAGYRVEGDAFLGAVDVMYPGRVWFDKTLEYEDRAGLTCLFAGMLLYVPVDPPKP